MSDKNAGKPDGPHQHAHGASPTPQQIRTVGSRRREAEEKLEHHLEEARQKEDHDNAADPGAGTALSEDAGDEDAAEVQNKDRLTAADRVDPIDKQVIPEHDANGSQHPNVKP